MKTPARRLGTTFLSQIHLGFFCTSVAEARHCSEVTEHVPTMALCRVDLCIRRYAINGVCHGGLTTDIQVFIEQRRAYIMNGNESDLPCPLVDSLSTARISKHSRSPFRALCPLPPLGGPTFGLPEYQTYLPTSPSFFFFAPFLPLLHRCPRPELLLYPAEIHVRNLKAFSRMR